MRFVSRAPRSKTFWVEEFTKEEKEFLIYLGFTDKEPHSSNMVSKAYYSRPTLYFVGSDIFELWSNDEVETIHNTIRDTCPDIDEIVIEHFIAD
jgi:hypothetical protein